jgi:Holliday junction resolvase RusA-like endonuclease
MPEQRTEALTVALPDVVSWSRPRRLRGGVRYPPEYVRARDVWALVVAQAVRCQGWHPPPAARYRVAVAVRGGGRRDLDRVCTAVLDALQAGGAIRDDALVDRLVAARRKRAGAETPRTEVTVRLLPLPLYDQTRRRARG